jgi:predicted MFS family arabinose efflux permease
VLPLSLFRDPIIAVSTVAVFLFGMGMFGVIVYVPLFMQAVLGVSATRSGSLLTPLMLAFVVASVISGNLMSRTGRYRVLALIGAALATGGMFLMAAMDANTAQRVVIINMIFAGLGMGMAQPVYTLAVQNVAPPAQMGAATASTQFFRSIGATLGVAVFGSVMLTLYHDRFQSNIPRGTPARALTPFQNPLLLAQIRPRLEAAFGAYPGGAQLLHKLLDNVRAALVYGLHAIFVMGAVLMVLAVVVNLFLREVPLRRKHHGHVAVE